jgi:1-acyl-sn-glycerol-3-phosphate acyltransferase
MASRIDVLLRILGLMIKLTRFVFFGLFVRFLVYFYLGLNVRHRHRLPKQGPVVIVSNHNSHLDTLVLMSLFPYRLLPKLRPMAAADYFLRNRLIAWFSLNVVGIIPVGRKQARSKNELFLSAGEALEASDMLILFPEGSRGKPEQRVDFKRGISHLIEQNPDVPVLPVFLHGLGKALPKGESLLIPFFCDVFIGEPISFQGERKQFMQDLEAAMDKLVDESGLAY